MPHRFTATIQDAGTGGAYVVVPFDVEAAYGSKQPRVKATFDGVPYRGTLVRRGGAGHLLVVLKGIRRAGRQGAGRRRRGDGRGRCRATRGRGAR